MQRYGLSNYIVDSGATEICTDDAGTLYRKEVLNDEPILMVKVSDGSIRDPDGSYRTYFLRVPPDIETAQAAVAWSFSLDADEYLPSIQT